MKKIISLLILIGMLSACRKENPIQIKPYSELNYDILAGIEAKEINPGVSQYHYELPNSGKLKLIVTLVQPNKKTKRLYETSIAEGNQQRLSVIAFMDDVFVAVHENNIILESYQFKKDPNYQLDNQILQRIDYTGLADSMLALPRKASFAIASAIFDVTAKQDEFSSFVSFSKEKLDWKLLSKQLSKEGFMILVELQAAK